jgi:hypothetical protein
MGTTDAGNITEFLSGRMGSICSAMAAHDLSEDGVEP